jgi:hypothetical protein
MGWCQGIYTCVGICDRVMHMDLWSYFYSMKGEHDCGCSLCADSSRVDGVSCC